MKFKIIKACFIGVLAAGVYSGCKPEQFEKGNGLSAEDLNATFTVTPVASSANKFVIQASEGPGLIGVKWDLGDGGGSNAGKMRDTVLIPDAGKYTITLTAIGKGGITKTSSQDITVATSDPESGNLIQGAKMQAADDAQWTHLAISPGVTFAIENGKMIAKGGNGGHAGVYQAVDVVAGKKYKVDMLVSGSGATDTWFEVYADSKAPVSGSDYTSNNKLISLNTWGGCGNATFSGLLSAISCSGNGNTITFPTTGKVYLVIKSGGANLGLTGISFTNVQFRGVK
jgi:PKD repeat protein